MRRRCAAAPIPSARRWVWAPNKTNPIRLKVVEVARDLGTKPAVVALAYVLSRPFVTSPIIGASKPHHLEDAVAALSLKLDAETLAKLEAPYRSKAVAGH